MTLPPPDKEEEDAMESSVVRWLAGLLVVIAFCAVLQKLGIRMDWPF